MLDDPVPSALWQAFLSEDQRWRKLHSSAEADDAELKEARGLTPARNCRPTAPVGAVGKTAGGALAMAGTDAEEASLPKTMGGTAYPLSASQNSFLLRRSRKKL